MAISQQIKNQIINLYAQDISISKIRHIVNVSEPTISKILKSAGVTIRKKNYQKLNLDKKEINNLYNSGLSTYQIATKFNCSDETIRKLVDDLRPVQVRNRLSEKSINKISKASERNWKDDEYRQRVSLGKTPGH